MKLKKLMKKYSGDFLQLHEAGTGITSRVMNKYEIRNDYWDNLERKVISFEFTTRCNTNETVLWVELLQYDKELYLFCIYFVFIRTNTF